MIIEQKALPTDLVEKCTQGLRNYKSQYRVLLETTPIDSLGSSADFVDACLLTSFDETLAMLKAEFAPLQGKRVLNIACNVGLFLEYLVRQEGVIGVGVDTNQLAVTFAREKGNLNVVIGDAAALSDIGRFDIVIAHHLLDVAYFGLSKAPKYIVGIMTQARMLLNPGCALVSGYSNFQISFVTQVPFARMVDYGGLPVFKNYMFFSE